MRQNFENFFFFEIFENKIFVGIMIARLLRRKLYAWCNAYRKRVNAKVRNYDLRDLNNEMNRKSWNFIEINKLSGWKLAPLRK